MLHLPVDIIDRVDAAAWHGDYADGGADDYTWTMVCVPSTPPPPPSVYSMSPAEAGQGTSGYLTISGQYLSYATGINVSGTGVSMYVTEILSDNQIEAGYTVDSNASPGPRTVTVSTTSGASNELTFTVTAPPTGCGDQQKDTLIAEYQNPQYQQTWVPACSDVIAPVGSAHFSAAEINQDNDYGASWTITRDNFLSGMECVRAAGGSQPMALTSGYRNPASQMRINPSSPNSRHTRGDAADAGETDSWRRQQMKQVWGPGCGACVEPLELTPTWVHFDWRGACPAGW